jgi:hypothetical protein
MIVPLELNLLAMRRGYLSPQLALGWRIGGYIIEFFSNLEQVRIAAKKEGDAALGLSMMCQKSRFSFPVTIAKGQRPWDFLAYHYPTGTTLQFITVSNLVELPAGARKLEAFFKDGDSNPVRSEAARSAIGLYRAAIDGLIARVLSRPVDQYCQIRESRLRLLGTGKNPENQPLRCRLCDRPFPRSKLMDFGSSPKRVGKNGGLIVLSYL